jgi:carbamoyl-phosphate synthase large subunit
VLERYGVELIGASREAIDMAEDRELFKQGHDRDRPRGAALGIAHSMEEARAVQGEIGFPTIIRPSVHARRHGGGIAYNREEFEEIVERGLDLSPTTRCCSRSR